MAQGQNKVNQAKQTARKLDSGSKRMRTNGPLSVPPNHRVRRFFGIRAPGAPY